jgi:hypothetical protein
MPPLPNHMTEEIVNTTRVWGTIEPDTRYTVGSVNVRFEIPLGVSYDMMVLFAQPHVQKAIADFERLGDGHGNKWKHYDKFPVQYHVSEIGLNRPSLDKMNEFGSPDAAIGSRQGLMAMPHAGLPTGTVAMVAEVFFLRPVVFVNADEEREMRETLDERDGFVPLDEIEKLKETLGNAQWKHPDRKSDSDTDG